MHQVVVRDSSFQFGVAHGNLITENTIQMGLLLVVVLYCVYVCMYICMHLYLYISQRSTTQFLTTNQTQTTKWHVIESRADNV